MANQLQAAEARAVGRRGELPHDLPSANGIYVSFESVPEVELALESLDPRQGNVHPELVAVREVIVEGVSREKAVVFIPDGKLGYFFRRLAQYADTAGEERPRHTNLVDRIQSIALASLEQLWTDEPGEFPEENEEVWWELWLRRRDGQEREHVEQFAESIDAPLRDTSLAFADRIVVLIYATAAQLSTALDVLDDLAELRPPRQPAALLALQPAADQAQAVEVLAARVRGAGDVPAATILDTGVYRAHSLLAASLATEDCHSVDPAWGLDDREGRGTEMAGLALYGDLGAALDAPRTVRLRHRLESVKILPPPPGANPPELYGAITATAASLVEIQAPDRRRVFSQAVTAEFGLPAEAATMRFGLPTSWSAAIDALAAGLGIDVTEDGLVLLNEDEVDAQRLFLIAAGNLDGSDDDHLDRSDLEPIEDPGQAWNALTVGAYTDLTDLDAAPDFEGWWPIAAQGELSPFSRTSVAFDRDWPRKPDVVLEGGNTALSPDGEDVDTPEVFQLLTTKAPLRDQRLLTVANATSAATAQAAHLAASILADDPTLWPETVRALIVHSAEWTEPMKDRFEAAGPRRERVALHRRYGMGVPDLGRAIRSATDALTLIVQDVIHPFDGEGRTREMHLHELPWPTDELAALGEAEVRMRVTLSYFIEPNPGRRGWVRRYSYASHGLRFEVRRATESTEDFRKRVNARARSEDERRPQVEGDSAEWLFGPDQRTAGSIHSDIWHGTAADLAERGLIAVFPVSGWWKERKERDHSARGARYALIVSIETEGIDVDIWTPVAQAVGVEVEIDV